MTTVARAKIGPNDRLGMTLMLTIILHAVAAFGITFAASEPLGTELANLDVILVQTSSIEAPEKADFLAQANQIGGGDSDRKLRPSDLFSAPVPKPEPGLAPVPTEDAAPEAQEARKNDAEVLTVQRSETEIENQTPQEESPVSELEKREEAQRKLEMASLAAEISQNRQAYAKRPIPKFISANTKQDGYAQYMQSWVAKVERVGNINYPEEAKTRDLQGSLVLTVAIRRDGSVQKVEIIQSSGEAVLDDAARQIIEIAAPFDVTPEVKGERYDVLYITRTWQFLPGNVLQSH
jgi:periplasmic protein TonB